MRRRCAGHLLVREMRQPSLGICNRLHFGRRSLQRNRLILGVPVRGTADDLERIIRAYRVDELVSHASLEWTS
jgi:hypothetical protein